LGLYLCKCSDFGPSADFQTLGIQSFDCRQSDFQLVEIALVQAAAAVVFSKSIVAEKMLSGLRLVPLEYSPLTEFFEVSVNCIAAIAKREGKFL